MWEPNEQLLLRAPVRYKNRDGSLFVTPRRVAWQQQGIPQLNPSISYDTISGMAFINNIYICILIIYVLNIKQIYFGIYVFYYKSTCTNA